MTVYLLYNEPVKNSSSYSKTFFDSEHGFPNHGKTVREYGLEDKIAKISKYILKYIFKKREGMETKKAGFTGFDECRCTLVFKISYTGLA